MTISLRTGLSGLFLTSLLVISGCSSSSSSDDGLVNDDGSVQNPETQIPTDEVPGGPVDETPDVTDTPDGTPTPDVTDTPGGTPTPDVTDTPDGTESPDGNQTPDENAAPDEVLPNPSEGGFDASGGDDDSPTAVETASLAGPSIKDASRSAGPPSTPGNLTLLLAAEDWLEFSWAPSSDDQAVVAYEIYRDGALIATVQDSDYEHDRRSWLSTSFIDCNYTRYVDCVGARVPVPGASYSYSVLAIDNEGMRSEMSTPADFTFEQITAQAPDLAGYQTVFEDEFEGSNLDINK